MLSLHHSLSFEQQAYLLALIEWRRAVKLAEASHRAALAGETSQITPRAKDVLWEASIQRAVSGAALADADRRAIEQALAISDDELGCA